MAQTERTIGNSFVKFPESDPFPGMGLSFGQLKVHAERNGKNKHELARLPFMLFEVDHAAEWPELLPYLRMMPIYSSYGNTAGTVSPEYGAIVARSYGRGMSVDQVNLYFADKFPGVELTDTVLRRLRGQSLWAIKTHLEDRGSLQTFEEKLSKLHPSGKAQTYWTNNDAREYFPLEKNVRIIKNIRRIRTILSEDSDITAALVQFPHLVWLLHQLSDGVDVMNIIDMYQLPRNQYGARSGIRDFAYGNEGRIYIPRLAEDITVAQFQVGRYWDETEHVETLHHDDPIDELIVAVGNKLFRQSWAEKLTEIHTHDPALFEYYLVDLRHLYRVGYMLALAQRHGEHATLMLTKFRSTYKTSVGDEMILSHITKFPGDIPNSIRSLLAIPQKERETIEHAWVSKHGRFIGETGLIGKGAYSTARRLINNLSTGPRKKDLLKWDMLARASHEEATAIMRQIQQLLQSDVGAKPISIPGIAVDELTVLPVADNLDTSTEQPDVDAVAVETMVTIGEPEIDSVVVFDAHAEEIVIPTDAESARDMPTWVATAYGEYAVRVWAAIQELPSVIEFYQGKGNPYAYAESVKQFVSALVSGNSLTEIVSTYGIKGFEDSLILQASFERFMRGHGDGATLKPIMEIVRGISHSMGNRLVDKTRDGYTPQRLFVSIAAQLTNFHSRDKRYISSSETLVIREPKYPPEVSL